MPSPFSRLLLVVGVIFSDVVCAEPPATVERFDPKLDALIARDAVVEIYAEDITWAEGPLWDKRQKSLLFSDVPRNAIYKVNASHKVELYYDRSGYTSESKFEGREPGSNGLTFDAQGRLVFCQHGNRSIARREHDGSITVLADRYQGKKLNSPNDLVYRSNGDLYFTDPPFGLPKTYNDPAKESPIQGVYRLTPKGELTAVVTDLQGPNGIGFSPDEKTLYVANSSLVNAVWMAYPVNKDGTLGAGKQFANSGEYLKSGGVPDGLKIDKRGNVFAAGPGGVHIFAPDGTRLGRIFTGVPTGNVAWGEDGRTLFIAANHRILRLRTLTLGAIR